MIYFPKAFPESSKLITTGNPVRQDICQISTPEERYQQREAEKKACELLNIEFRDKIQNYSYDAWLEDCQKRASYLHIREQENQLNALESKLNQLVSPDKRRELELELLAKSITSLKI